MKKQIILLAALTVGALVSNMAQDSSADSGRPGRPPGGPGGPGHRPPVPAIVAALDVNKDGVIDATELANAVAALSALDKNGDGVLTPDEFMGHPKLDGDGGPKGDGPRHRGPRPPQPQQ